MGSSGFVGIDFQLCPRCGGRADLVFEGIEEGFVGLYCVRCGNKGKLSKKSARTHPAAWEFGPQASAHGMDAAADEHVLVTAGLSFKVPWVNFSGPRERILENLVDGSVKDSVASMLDSLETAEGM